MEYRIIHYPTISLQERIEEFKRAHSIGHYFNIDTQIITPSDAAKLSPILNPKNFKAALYCPGDAHIDPTMLCSSLIKGATKRGAQVCWIILTSHDFNFRE